MDYFGIIWDIRTILKYFGTLVELLVVAPWWWLLWNISGIIGGSLVVAPWWLLDASLGDGG